MVPIPKTENINKLNINIEKQCLKYGTHKIEGKNRAVAERFENEKTFLINFLKFHSAIFNYASL